MDDVYVHFTKKSSNAKTGPIPTTTSSRNTCPTTCPLLGNGGCYAEAGYYTRLHWDKVSNGERGGSPTELCTHIRGLPEGQVWRHNVAGDLPSSDSTIDAGMVAELVDANKGRRGFTYTHHEVVSNPINARIVMEAVEAGFTINLSGNSPTHADSLFTLNIAPVTTILPEDRITNCRTPAGRSIVICPAVTHPGVTCASCKLCAIPTRKVIIGFPAHGRNRKKISI